MCKTDFRDNDEKMHQKHFHVYCSIKKSQQIFSPLDFLDETKSKIFYNKKQQNDGGGRQLHTVVGFLASRPSCPGFDSWDSKQISNDILTPPKLIDNCGSQRKIDSKSLIMLIKPI